MKKKVSFKSVSDESSEMEQIKLSINDIDKKNIFNNNSEIVVKNILEKIIINVFIIIKVKELDHLLETKCSNFLLQEINSLISHYYLCYEKEKYFLTDNLFVDNYLREEPPWEECNLTQPTPGKMDRWKIHRIEVTNLKGRNKSQISEIDEGQSVVYDKKSKKGFKRSKVTKLSKKIKEDKEKEKEKEKEREREKQEEEERIKNRKLGIRDMDSFPSYPLSDELFKVDINLTKEQEKQIEQYRAELLLREEIKKKEDEKKVYIEKIKNGVQIKNENLTQNKKKVINDNRYKGRNIGVTTNGEIIFIQNVSIDNLKSEFLEINSKMKNPNRNMNKSNTLNSSERQKNDKKAIEIEKNLNDEAYLDFYKINNKERLAQQMITGGSSFKNFVPEIGVNLKQNGSTKSGGTDFLHKYKKLSLEQFEKTLEIFKKTSHAFNEIVEMKNDIKNSKNNNNNSNNINSNLLNSTNLINNNINSNINFNYINQKSLIKSSSLPDINPINSRTNLESSNMLNANNNMNINNDSNIKNSFYFTNYNNSNFMSSTKYNNMNNFIKTSSSFKNLFFHDENPLFKEENFIPTYTTKHFFKNFKPKIKNSSSFSKNERSAFSKIQDFNKDIMNNNNWGEVAGSRTRNINKGKPFINGIKKNYFTKTINNIFRVRKNVNENYFQKMKIFNKISLRSQSTDNNNGGIIKKFEKKK